jgi:hypothetical protein
MVLRFLFFVTCCAALSSCSDYFDNYGEPPKKPGAKTNPMEQFSEPPERPADQPATQ